MSDHADVGTQFRKLVEIMARLGGPAGCPWDRKQTPATLRTYILEEALETVHALSEGDSEHVCEELGDLLLQVVFVARLFEERNAFDIETVVRGLTAKLIARHPHVFGDKDLPTAEDVLRNWEAMKAAERGHKGLDDRFRAVLGRLPALLEAFKVQQIAARIGFDWPDEAGPLAKVREEVDELEALLEGPEATGDGPAQPQIRVEEEIGDLLFACVNLARHLGVNPAIALYRANRKFVRRFLAVERELTAQGRPLASADLAEMDAVWDRIKDDEMV